MRQIAGKTTEQLRESIVGQIPDNAPFYSILADEVTDIVNKEQLSLTAPSIRNF